MYPRKLTRQVICEPDYPVVQTKAGKLRGLLEEGTFLFRGVQYAKAKRFHLPEPVDPWEGTRDAIIYGPVCPEIHTAIAHDEYNVPHYHYIQDEDCLYLNIWTQHINEDRKRPVMVWIHGGGFATGSSIELYAYDGMELAQFGDVVVVSLNHRLNCIGYLDLTDFGYEHTANMGTLDLVAALKWVHENIAAFGGDPDNVTIMGQSGGGGKVATLLQTPAADGLYHKAIIQSGLMGKGRQTLPETSKALGAEVVAQLGLTAETIRKIETIPYYKLARAAQAATESLAAKTGIRAGWGPVADGVDFVGSGQIVPFREQTKHVYVMAGSVMGEFAQNYNNIYAPGEKNSWSDALVDELIAKVYGDSAEAVKAAFAKAYPDKKIVDCLYFDNGSRVGHRDFCFKRAAEGCAPAYNFVFNLECPLNNGTIPWHNAEEAYMFHNANYLEASYIPGVSERLQDIMTGAWVAFAATGDPNHIGMPIWEPATEQSGACMIFDAETKPGHHFDDELTQVMPPRAMNFGGDRKPLTTFGGGPRQSL